MDFPGRGPLVRSVQSALGIKVDGKDGPATWGAIARAVKAGPVQAAAANSSIPADRYDSIVGVYGQAGDERNLVRFRFPYAMRLYKGPQTLKTHRCHRLAKDDLEGILETARDELGMDFIREYDLDTFYGCYNHRNMRGRSRSISRHSWGIAIDFAAHRNGLRTPWPSRADMPEQFIAIFERFGWKSGARAWAKDAMHFQRTR